MVELISILFVDTYWWRFLAFVFFVSWLYALHVHHSHRQVKQIPITIFKAFSFFCVFMFVSAFRIIILFIPSYIIGVSVLSSISALISETVYRFFFVIIFFILLFASLYPVYKKCRQKWWRAMVRLRIKRFTFLSGYIVLWLLVVVIEYLFDFRPNTNQLDLLNQSMNMHYSQREVYNHYQWCWIPFTCKEYFRFHTTRKELDELIQEQWFEEYWPESTYFYDIMDELDAHYIHRFHPSEDSILYYYAEVENYDLFLYYDTDNTTAYLITSYMH